LTRGLWLYFYSHQNLLGVLLALLGLLGYFLGWIDRYWFPIVCGLYGIGWMLVPKDPKIDLHFQSGLNDGEIRSALADLLSKVKKGIPSDIYAKLENIRDSILEILPRLKDSSADAKTVFTVRETTLEYLPAALQAYLKLPKAYATMHTVKDGKTARHLLMDQMVMLDTAMKDILINLANNDSQKLMANGRFLEDKFLKNELSL
jgi:hypothetical protein